VATLGVPILVERGTWPLGYINPMHSVEQSEVWYGKHISQEIGKGALFKSQPNKMTPLSARKDCSGQGASSIYLFTYQKESVLSVVADDATRLRNVTEADRFALIVS
jgi:hypothetical protein